MISDSDAKRRQCARWRTGARLQHRSSRQSAGLKAAATFAADFMAQAAIADSG